MRIGFNSLRLKIKRWTNTIKKAQGKGHNCEVTLLPSHPPPPSNPRPSLGKGDLLSSHTCSSALQMFAAPSVNEYHWSTLTVSGWECKPKSLPFFCCTIGKYLSNMRALRKTKPQKSNSRKQNRTLDMKGKVSMHFHPTQWSSLWAAPASLTGCKVDTENSLVTGWAPVGAAWDLKQLQDSATPLYKRLCLGLFAYRTNPDFFVGARHNWLTISLS